MMTVLALVLACVALVQAYIIRRERRAHRAWRVRMRLLHGDGAFHQLHDVEPIIHNISVHLSVNGRSFRALMKQAMDATDALRALRSGNARP